MDLICRAAEISDIFIVSKAKLSADQKFWITRKFGAYDMDMHTLFFNAICCSRRCNPYLVRSCM